MNTLKSTRISHGITLESVADKADVSRATVNNAERGKTVKLVYANKIVNALNDLAGTSYTVDGLGISTSN